MPVTNRVSNRASPLLPSFPFTNIMILFDRSVKSIHFRTRYFRN